jgi:TetR/AcrR family transcriptional repressor of bet genes
VSGPSTTTRAAQKQETRRALLRAAEEVFLKEPPALARLEDVAAHAGVSKATLFFHFGTRADLLAAVAYRLYVRRAAVTDADRHTGLRDYLEEYLAGMRLPEVRLIWQLGDLIGADHPELLEAAYVHLTGELESILRRDGLAADRATELAAVLCPALMMVARRAASDLGSRHEVGAFVDAAERLVTR